MAKLIVCSVYDSKVESFGPPMFGRARGELLRGFIDAANDPKVSISQHPEDYTLFELGTFDDDKGLFECLNTPKSLGLAIDFIKAPDGTQFSKVKGN